MLINAQQPTNLPMPGHALFTPSQAASAVQNLLQAQPQEHFPYFTDLLKDMVQVFDQATDEFGHLTIETDATKAAKWGTLLVESAWIEKTGEGLKIKAEFQATVLSTVQQAIPRAIQAHKDYWNA